MQSLGIVLMCVAAAVCYGIVHDQVTARVCVEYFTVGHPPVFGTDDPTLLGLGWGVIATWWAGLLVGIPLALVARAGSRPRRTVGSLVRPVAGLLAVMAVCAFAAGVVGWLLASAGLVVLVGPIAQELPAERHVPFLADLWAHSASYFFGFAGGVVVMVMVWRSRGRAARVQSTGLDAAADHRSTTGNASLSSAATGGGFDQEARRIEATLPPGPRVAILGSTDFWHADSERTCARIGQLLAGIRGLVLLTGGVEGIGEAVGRSFFRARCESGQEPRVYHVLPEGEEAWDYGETLFAGADMTERREVLGRLSKVFLMVEGGPRAGHEADVAAAHGAVVIPVGRSGGHAAALFGKMSRPPAIDSDAWATLGSNQSTPEEAATAAIRAVQACVDSTS
ncbi:SLOG cluster 4 domain-containing protein [Paludisphaera rhizosphaerae]|uniref:SLOG cluster 4 domain-containing protein n=1 Tax=Paludisphaera rhizosphaerae TaxID=2711216 RepID=UPI0019814A90|nr:hypothetical protein [Paludisphaera rhizosphaerae]